MANNLNRLEHALLGRRPRSWVLWRRTLTEPLAPGLTAGAGAFGSRLLVLGSARGKEEGKDAHFDRGLASVPLLENI